jgi:DNA-binding transcriptional LysR family regulator
LEILFDDRFIVASAKDSRWARRRKIDLADLIEARWVLSAPNTLGYTGVAEAFRLRGLAMPEVTVISSSVAVANRLLAKNQAVTVTSKFAAETAGLHVLPIDLGLGSWPALIFTLKNRTLNPVAERFIACAREVVKSIARRPNGRAHSKPNVA